MVQHQVSDRLLLVGTAHVSPESVQEVKAAVRDFDADVVAIELDPLRMDALENPRRWESTPVHRLLQSDKLWLFLTQVLLSSYQRKLGEEFGAPPGAEMLAGAQAARARGARILLADRDVSITMKRAMGEMRFREKLRLFWELFKAMLGGQRDEDQPETAAELLEEDAVSAMMAELGNMAPSVKRVVIDERDEYLASRIRGALEPTTLSERIHAHRRGRPPRVVAVVGAGHLPGIRARLKEPTHDSDLSRLETLPQKKVKVGKILFAWLFPALILGAFGFFAWQGIQEGNWDKLTASLQAWIIYNGTLAALGALIARGHILSIITAFVAAPLTSLNPFLAAGWFAGIVEAWKRTPTVQDFNKLSQMTTMKDFFGNRVMRVLMVAALANLGSILGSVLAGLKIIEIATGG